MITRYYRYHGHRMKGRRKNGATPVLFDLGFSVKVKKYVVLPGKVPIGESRVFDIVKDRSGDGERVWVAKAIHDEWIGPFKYRCDVERVYDGDTITKAVIHLGFDSFVTDRLRLFGINTPEMRGTSKEAGIISRDRFSGLVLDKTVTVETVKVGEHRDSKGKYGRYLATVWIGRINVNKLLMDEGLAKRYGE